MIYGLKKIQPRHKARNEKEKRAFSASRQLQLIKSAEEDVARSVAVTPTDHNSTTTAQDMTGV